MKKFHLLFFAVVSALLIGYIEFRLPVTVGAQGRDAVYQRLAVTGVVKLEAFRGQISAFNGACPSGWTELTELRGRFIVGLVDGGTLAQSVGDALTNGELRRGGTSHSGPSYTRPSLSENFSVSYTRPSVDYERPSVDYTRPTVSHDHLHNFTDKYRNFDSGTAASGTQGIVEVDDLNYSAATTYAHTAAPSLSGGSVSISGGDAEISGGGASLSGSITFSRGSMSGGGASNKLPPAPYLQLRYCEYQP